MIIKYINSAQREKEEFETSYDNKLIIDYLEKAIINKPKLKYSGEQKTIKGKKYKVYYRSYTNLLPKFLVRLSFIHKNKNEILIIKLELENS